MYAQCGINLHTYLPSVSPLSKSFWNVNHVKLIPHRASRGEEGHRRHGAIGGQKHKGYEFLFVMDHESGMAVERYVGAFSGNQDAGEEGRLHQAPR